MPALVSIITPAYNAEKWISESIKSVIAQDWKQKELIIVDDGSTDNTLAVARSFESPTVKVITQENMGASAARNKGLSIAQGDYIQWLDADDLLSPTKISWQLKDAESVTSSRTLFSSSFGTFFVQPHKTRFVPNDLWQDLEPINFLLTIFTQNLWMNPAVWLVSRKLTELAGTWDERLSLDDDGEYFSRVVAASEYVKFNKIAKVYYRLHNIGSLSRSVSNHACESLLLSLSMRINQLRHLEDSERTRGASVMLLQTWLDYFYPEKEELLRRVYDLAQELGGTLSTPKLSWKYSPIMKLFGGKGTKRVRSLIAKLRLLANVQYERLVLSFSKRKPGLL